MGYYIDADTSDDFLDARPIVYQDGSKLADWPLPQDERDDEPDDLPPAA